MRHRVQSWLDQLQVADPAERPQALLLQTLLLGMCSVLVALIGGTVAAAGPTVLLSGRVLPSIALLLVAATALALLRRGAFALAVTLVIAALFVGQTHALLTVGLRRDAGQLLFSLVPITIAGLLLRRRALLLTGAATMLSVGAIAWREAASAAPSDGPTVGIIVIRFALTVGLLILFLDRFAGALREARERLRVTLASIGDAVIATDAAGGVSFMNPVAEALTAWPVGEASGRPLDDVLVLTDPATGARVDSPVARVLQRQTATSLLGHATLRARDGAEVPIDDSAAPIRDARGGLSGVVVVFRDIRERRRAQAQLSERERLFRTMADSAPVLIWVADTDRRCTFFNQPWLTFTGRSLDQELGDGWTEGVHPDDRERCLATCAAAFDARQPFEMDYRLRRADGVYRWLFDRGTPRYTPDGDFVGYIGSCLDITERKEAEEAQRFLTEASAALASSLEYEVTLQRLVELAVPALADWCVINMRGDDGQITTPALAVADPTLADLGRALADRYPVTMAAPHGAGRVLRTGAAELVPNVADDWIDHVATDPAHASLLRRLGLRSTLSVPLIARGRVLGALTLVSGTPGQYHAGDQRLVEELAARAALAVDNARLYRNAQRAIATRDEFLATASHELKTPLTAILGFARLLQRRHARESLLGERDARALQAIVSQSVRLEGLVRMLLDLSRIDASKLELDIAPVDIGELTQRMVDELRPTLVQHTVRVEHDPEPLLIAGDAPRLEQVVQNLLHNAVKYSPAGGVVTVRLAREGEAICLAVSDEGIGIPADALPHLFGRFYRAPNVSPQQISGTGIGLYLVREIISRHAGSVAVTSQEGVGSTFVVRLPLLGAPSLAPD